MPLIKGEKVIDWDQLTLNQALNEVDKQLVNTCYLREKYIEKELDEEYHLKMRELYMKEELEELIHKVNEDLKSISYHIYYQQNSC